MDAESAPTDLTDLDGNAIIARESERQHKLNRDRLLKRLGLTTILSGTMIIDPDKLYQFLKDRYLDQE